MKRLAKLCRKKYSNNAANDGSLASVPRCHHGRSEQTPQPHDKGQHHRQFYVRQRRRTIERTAVVAVDLMPIIEDLRWQTCLMDCSVMTGLLIRPKNSGCASLCCGQAVQNPSATTSWNCAKEAYDSDMEQMSGIPPRARVSKLKSDFCR